jgi:hypothetical protein
MYIVRACFMIIDGSIIMFRTKKLRRVIDGYIGIVSR